VRDRNQSPHLERPRPRSGLRLLAALVVSLLVNAGLLRLVDASWLREAAPQREVGLAPLAASDWERNRRVDPAPRPAPARAVPPAPPEPERAEPEGQVVDLGPAREDEKSAAPKEARYLAERSSSVEKETRSRHQGIYERPAPVPTAKGEAAPDGLRNARPDAAPPPAREAVERRKELALALSPLATLKLPQSREATPGEEGGSDSTSPPSPGVRAEQGLPGANGRNRLDLRPRAGLLADLSAGPAPDHLGDVEEGEGTFLNAREWRYAGYFNRIKQQVATNWEPNEALAVRDPDGRRYAYKDRFTLVRVRLDDHGALKAVAVQRSSGVDFLDRVAVDAFRRAQPFQNPPPGIADARGEIVFNFGFYLDVGGGLRLFRAPMPRD